MVRHSDDTAKKPRSRQAEKASPRKGGGRTGGPRAAKAPEKPVRKERIAKTLARAGVASRREVERLIGLGKIAVNGRILDTPAVLVGRDDVITVEGKVVGGPEATRVWRYHKPVGLLTTHKDPAGRPTVFDALPPGLPRVISVGRLDINSEGLLLLTNDGELARALEMPDTAWVRRYRARARGRVTQAELDRLKDGITVDGVQYGPMEATLDKAKPVKEGERGGANIWISVALTEGKNREVRKVLEAVGVTVNRLIRLAYGPFQLGALATGDVEEVGPRVIRELLADHIRPESLPTGNAVATPAPIPGRRGPQVSTRKPAASALADPSRKPSRVRAAAAAAEAGAAEATTPARARPRPGWAKPSPRPERSGRPARKPRPAGGPDRGDAPDRGEAPPGRPFKAGGKPSGKPGGGGRPSPGPRGGRPGKPGGRPGGKPRGPGKPR